MVLHGGGLEESKTFGEYYRLNQRQVSAGRCYAELTLMGWVVDPPPSHVGKSDLSEDCAATEKEENTVELRELSKMMATLRESPQPVIRCKLILQNHAP